MSEGLITALVVIAVVVAIITWALFPIFLGKIAEESILCTNVNEGTAKAIMRGNSFDHFIISFAGHHLNDPRKLWYKKEHPDWEVLYHGKGNKNGFVEKNAVGNNEQLDDYYDDRHTYLKKLGLYWIGIPWVMSVHVYPHVKYETYTDNEEAEQKFSHREAADDISLAAFTFSIKSFSAKTKDRLSTDALTLVTFVLRNPYCVLFSNDNMTWMKSISAAISHQIRTFVGSKTYDEIVSSKSWDADLKGFSASIIGLNDNLADDGKGSKPSGLKDRYGIEIRAVALRTLKLSDDENRHIQAATTRKYVAEQDAEAVRIDGKAKADALDVRLRVIEGHDGAGEMLAQLDAMEKASKGAGNTVIWANNPFVPKKGEKQQ